MLRRVHHHQPCLAPAPPAHTAGLHLSISPPMIDPASTSAFTRGSRSRSAYRRRQEPARPPAESYRSPRCALPRILCRSRLDDRAQRHLPHLQLLPPIDGDAAACKSSPSCRRPRHDGPPGSARSFRLKARCHARHLDLFEIGAEPRPFLLDDLDAQNHCLLVARNHARSFMQNPRLGLRPRFRFRFSLRSNGIVISSAAHPTLPCAFSSTSQNSCRPSARSA